MNRITNGPDLDLKIKENEWMSKCHEEIDTK